MSRCRYSLSPAVSPTARQVVQAQAGGGGETVTGWIADYVSQTADLGHEFTAAARERMVDRVNGVDRWTADVAKRIHMEVVTAPSALPFAKWIEIEHVEGGNGGPSDDGGWSQLFKDDVESLGVGDILTYGWTMSYDMPAGSGAWTNHQHGIGTELDGWEFCDSFDVVDNDSWVFFFWWHGNLDPMNKWAVWVGDGSEPEDNNFTGQHRFAKEDPVEIQFQVHRTGTTTCHIYAWVFDPTTSPRTQLYGPEHFFNQDGDVSMADEPTLTLDAADFTTFVAGSNGVNGVWTSPLAHKHMGAFRIVKNQTTAGVPLGPYGSVTNGSETETPV